MTTAAVLPSPSAPAPMTRTSAFVSGGALAPLVVSCPTLTTAVVTIRTVKSAYRTYRMAVYINTTRTQYKDVRASSTGLVTARNAIAYNKTSKVRMYLNGVLAVRGYVTPRCGYVAAPYGSGSRGSATAFALNKNPNGTVVRWNPCDGDIRVRVNPTNGGSYALADMKAAITALRSATGLRFVYDGTTSFIPRSTNSGSQPAPLVIAYGSRSQTDLLPSGALGVGGWRSTGTSYDGVTWAWKIAKGFVVLDPGVKLKPGFARGVTRGALLLHELGHAAGLRHTTDSLQVLAPTLTSSSYASWGSGDKNGLAAVGAAKGCVTAA